MLNFGYTQISFCLLSRMNWAAMKAAHPVCVAQRLKCSVDPLFTFRIRMRQHVAPKRFLKPSWSPFEIDRILLPLSSPGVSRPRKSPRAMMPPESAPQVQPLLPIPSDRPDARRMAISGGRPPLRLWFRTDKTASEHINCPVLKRFSDRSLMSAVSISFFS